jgi:molecular chaperone DnaJ
VLGVAPEAGSPELRHAFRILAKSIHPDVAGTETAAAFQMVKTAYTVLSNPQSRHIYDAGRSLFGMHSKFGDFTGAHAHTMNSPRFPSHLSTGTLLVFVI